MKLIGRTLIIVIAALLVVGATYSLASAGWINTAGTGRGELAPTRFTPGTSQPTLTSSNPPERFEGRGNQGFNLFGVGEALKNFVVISGVVVVGVTAQNVATRVKWRAPAHQK